MKREAKERTDREERLPEEEREREFAHNRKEMNHLKWYSDETEERERERERGNVNLDFG